MATDARSDIYRDLHDHQLAAQIEPTRRSARRILGILFEYIQPASVLDVGCGLGTWLSVAAEMGVADYQGIEGNWLSRERACIDAAKITQLDLETGFTLGRRFDLAICLEVGEHLATSAADRLVASLCEHAPVVLFSAAIPFQGGHHHVNEQFPEYWASHFKNQGFHAVDLFRGRIWNDAEVLWWLRQNTLLFAHGSVLATDERLHREADISRPLDIVLPAVYVDRLRQCQAIVGEHQQLMQLLGQGGTFTVTRNAENQLTIQRQG